MLCAKFGWNWLSGSGEEVENVKSLQTDGQTDRRTPDKKWWEKLTWAFSSGELKKCVFSANYSNYVNLSDNHDDLLESDVGLIDDCVNLSDPYVNLSEKYDVNWIAQIGHGHIFVLNKWQVHKKIWQVYIIIWKVDIIIWQLDIIIWQVDIIIWQVVAELCHHTFLSQVHVFLLKIVQMCCTNILGQTIQYSNPITIPYLRILHWNTGIFSETERFYKVISSSLIILNIIPYN